MKIRIKLNEVKRIVRPPTKKTEPPPSAPMEQEEYEVTLPNGTVIKKKKPLPIKEHNYKILKDNLGNDSLIEVAMQKIPVLSEMRLKIKLAHGTQGTIFVLEDDRILKIYLGSYLGGIKREDDRYERLKTKVFSGTATKSDLLVYDHGIEDYDGTKLEFDSNRGGYYDKVTPSKFGWVVMGRVVTLQDFILIKNNMNYEKAREGTRAYEALYYDLNSYARTYLRKPDPKSALAKYSYYIYPTSVEDIKLDPSYEQEIIQKHGYPQSKIHIDEGFVDKFMDEVLQLYIDEGNDIKVFNDLHAGNIGVRNEIDPTPVIFDV